MNHKEIDAIFENSPMKLSRKLCIIVGSWPYMPKKDSNYRIFIFLATFITAAVPHFFGVYIQCGKNIPLCAENITGISYFTSILIKYLVPIFTKTKIEKVYEKIAKTWGVITDSEEIKLLEGFTNFGNLISSLFLGIYPLVLIAYVILAALFFSQITICPVILDFILPLNHSRSKILVINAEYIFDPFDYYYSLYVFYFITAVMSACIVLATDLTYTMAVLQILAIFEIAKHRLAKASCASDATVSNGIIISAIKMHKRSIEFLDLVESVYQFGMMCFILVTIILLSFGALIVVEHSNKFLDLIRMLILEVGCMIDIFFISWPGQLVINSCEELYISLYMIDWYNLSAKSKKELRFMMMCSLKPRTFTAGGIYDMNFENFLGIVKTTLSYMAITVSFHK